MRKPYPTDLSDAQWNYIEPHLPVPKEHGRPRIHTLREILDAFFFLRSGCQWRLLPHDFPRWPTVYYYFRKWRIDGTWEGINRALRERPKGSLEERFSAQSAGIVALGSLWAARSWDAPVRAQQAGSSTPRPEQSVFLPGTFLRWRAFRSHNSKSSSSM